MSSGPLAVPYAITSTPTGGGHEAARSVPAWTRSTNRSEMLDRRVGQHAVAQVEHVSGPAAGAGEDVASLPLHRIPGTEQDRGIQVPLDRAVVTDRRPGLVERDAVVDAEGVAPRVPHQLQQVPRPHPEVDRRHIRAGDPLEHPGRVRVHGAAIVVSIQHPDPRVEQLHRVHAGIDLARRCATTMSASVPRRRSNTAGSPYISAFVRSKVRLGPPSIR